MIERRLSMPRQVITCVSCGWVGLGLPLTLELQDARGESVPLTGNELTMQCPRCRSQCRVPPRPREVIDLDLLSALREARVTAAALAAAADTIESAQGGISPREMADRLPSEMTPVVTAAARFGSKEWLGVLGIVVTAALGIMNYDATRDAERARHSDAEKALLSSQEAANAKTTADFTDENIAEMSKRLNAYLEAQRAEKRAAQEATGRKTGDRKE